MPKVSFVVRFKKAKEGNFYYKIAVTKSESEIYVYILLTRERERYQTKKVNNS